MFCFVHTAKKAEVEVSKMFILYLLLSVTFVQAVLIYFSKTQLPASYKTNWIPLSFLSTGGMKLIVSLLIPSTIGMVLFITGFIFIISSFAILLLTIVVKIVTNAKAKKEYRREYSL
ncbi:hypothetical protein [Evansella halocellulosilytica]|uniref:hypothetical protein n=1 Tax=Evansella halocellulosilytica TaxID=2011013 RepID=UPI0011559750|nr:hypothetical protein [Evansella halocellulosilytica]